MQSVSLAIIYSLGPFLDEPQGVLQLPRPTARRRPAMRLTGRRFSAHLAEERSAIVSRADDSKDSDSQMEIRIEGGESAGGESAVTAQDWAPPGELFMERTDLDDEGRARLVGRTTWSHGLTQQEIRLVAHHSSIYQAVRGTIIFEEGADDPYMCLMLAGRVAVTKRDSAGATKVIAHVGPGRAFGEMSLIDGQPRSATVTVDQDAMWLRITSMQFEVLSRVAPTLGYKLVLRVARLLCQRLRQTSTLLVDYLDVEV
jgi:hypothetical protein